MYGRMQLYRCMQEQQDLTMEESDPEDKEDWLYGIFKTNQGTNSKYFSH